MRARTGSRLVILVHGAAAAAFTWLAWGYLIGNLGPDPIGSATRWSGRFALAFLLLSLVPTALRILTGVRVPTGVRRALGLYSAKFASLHLLVYAGLDYGFDVPLLLSGVRYDRFVLVGAAALFILLVLGATSSDWAVRRLGKNWRRLHRLTYVAGVLVVVHYAWTFKELRTTPTVVAAVLGLLLVLRIPVVRGGIEGLRRRES